MNVARILRRANFYKNNLVQKWHQQNSESKVKAPSIVTSLNGYEKYPLYFLHWFTTLNVGLNAAKNVLYIKKSLK